MASYIARRKFLAALGGVAAAWPLAARAQREKMRRIGVFTPLSADDGIEQTRNAGFLQGLQELGWTVGRNVQIDFRFGAGDPERYRRYAAELAALDLDLILATGSPTVSALQQANVSAPIVFVNVADPVGAGFVETVARPGGNATGFSVFEYAIAGKWLELLKEIAPRVTRAVVLRDSAIAAGSGHQAAASSSGVEVQPVGVRNAGEIERGVTAFARQPNGGLIVPGSALVIVHRGLIITLAARHRLPAVYSYRFFVSAGA